MVKSYIFSLTITFSMISASCLSQNVVRPDSFNGGNGAKSLATATPQDAGNPIIKGVYTADPSVIVFHDTVYLYTGHDETPPGINGYIMHDWLCFSSVDMVHWVAH